jgi:hypothetical protein
VADVPTISTVARKSQGKIMTGARMEIDARPQCLEEQEGWGGGEVIRMKIPPLRPRDSYKEARSQGETPEQPSYRLVMEAARSWAGS